MEESFTPLTSLWQVHGVLLYPVSTNQPRGDFSGAFSQGRVHSVHQQSRREQRASPQRCTDVKRLHRAEPGESDSETIQEEKKNVCFVRINNLHSGAAARKVVEHIPATNFIATEIILPFLNLVDLHILRRHRLIVEPFYCTFNAIMCTIHGDCSVLNAWC